MSSLLQDLSSAIPGPLGQLRNALAQIERLGGAAFLAGDPAELRRAASAWRQQAAALRELGSDLERQVQRTVAESWQGEASQTFAGNWGSLDGKLRDLAAGYDRMAAGLEQAAGRAGTLNSLVAQLVAEIEALLGALHVVQDPAAVGGLASHASALVARLEELLREVEAAWAEFLSWALATTLWFQHLLQTMPRVQPVAVPRPGWQIAARLGPGGASIELRPSAGAGAGARVRKGPPADAGSLWRWLLLLLAVVAGHDAGVLARLIALAEGDNDPKNRNNSKNPAEGEPAFGGPPQLGPPTEPPKNEKGEIDWAAWEARLRQKGITGDVAERIAAAQDGRPGAIEELTAAERLANAGYQVRFIKPIENAGRTNPDMEISTPGAPDLGGQSPLRVEVKSGRLTRKALNVGLDGANQQIKFAEGMDPAVSSQQQGCIVYDASRATTTGQLDEAGVEQYLKGKMKMTQLRQIRFLEVVYRDRGFLKRTFVFRNPDGSVTSPVSEWLSPW